MQVSSIEEIKKNFDVVWQAIPGTSQELAINSPCHHTLYCGSRGPGKTITQLMFFLKQVGLGYGSYWRGIVFDTEFRNLADLVAQSKRFFPEIFEDCRFLSSATQYKWVFATGEELLFAHAKSIQQYDSFHGMEFPYIGWNELTKWPTSDLYDKMMSTNRSSFPHEKHGLPPIPLVVFSTTNSTGVGAAWVRRRFIDVAEYGEIVEHKVEIISPSTKEVKIFTKTQVALFGSYQENIYLPDSYIADLNLITDINLKKSWLLGSWDVSSGGALDDIWNGDIHILPNFQIPIDWHVDRAFDWGSAKPYSVGWFAESNGEEVELDDGRTISFPPGTLIQIAELYGTNQIGSNKGTKESAKEISIGIQKIEKDLMSAGAILKQPSRGPADNSIGDNLIPDFDDIATVMGKNGIRWLQSDKKPGSRVIGLQLTRDRLQASVDSEGPGLYIMRRCLASLELFPSIARDPIKIEDVDTKAEDHIYDMIRYRVLHSTNRIAKEIEVRM